MRLDPRSAAPADVYRFMISAIVPRPIAWISTRGADGRTNLAPFSYFIALSSAPALVGVSIFERPGDDKDTLRNIRATREWVINVVTEPLLEAMTVTAGDWPAAVSEFERAGVTPVASEAVAPPGVAESPLRLECRLEREIAFGANAFVVGEIVLAHAADALLVDGRIDPAKLAAVGRLGGEHYQPLRDVRTVPRPRIARATGEPLPPRA